jgi:hypothetical protein
MGEFEAAGRHGVAAGIHHEGSAGLHVRAVGVADVLPPVCVIPQRN